MNLKENWKSSYRNFKIANFGRKIFIISTYSKHQHGWLSTYKWKIRVFWYILSSNYFFFGCVFSYIITMWQRIIYTFPGCGNSRLWDSNYIPAAGSPQENWIPTRQNFMWPLEFYFHEQIVRHWKHDVRVGAVRRICILSPCSSWSESKLQILGRAYLLENTHIQKR